MSQEQGASLVGTDAVLYVSRQYVSDRVITDEESIAHPPIAVRSYPSSVPLARVRWGSGLTVNLGNYESLRVDVQIELPCPVAELEEALNAAKAIAKRELDGVSKAFGKGA